MNKHIAISGAGIGGLTASLALRQLGYQVTVFERTGAPQPGGAGIVLAHNAMANLEQLGMGAAIRAAGMSLTEMTVRSAGGHVLSAASSVTTYRGRALSSVGIHRAALSDVLLAACRAASGIDIRWGQPLLDAESEGDGVTVRSDQGEERYEFLVGADGIHSRVRELLHGSEPVRYAGYHCFRGVAEGVFDLGRTMRESWGRGQRLGLVPVSPRHVYWFAVENAPPATGVPQAERQEHVLRHFATFAEPALAVVRATPTEEILQHDLGDRPPLEHWGRGRISLLGDAAHAMTPNMGQGAGQSIEDAVFLARALAQANPLDDPAVALRAYEHSRIDRANQFVTRSRRLGQVGQLDNPLLCWLRNAALYLTPDGVGEKSLTRLLRAGVPEALPAPSPA